MDVGVQQRQDHGVLDPAGTRVSTSCQRVGRRLRRVFGARWLECLSSVCASPAPELPGPSAAPLPGDDPGAGRPRGPVSARVAEYIPIRPAPAPASPTRPTQPPRIGGGTGTTGNGPGSPLDQAQTLARKSTLGQSIFARNVFPVLFFLLPPLRAAPPSR